MSSVLARGVEPAWQGGLKPREPRRQVLLRTRMRVDGASVDICIRNISSRGLLLQAVVPPACGTYVEICYPPQTIVARVVWANERRFGVHTREAIEIDAIVGDVALAGSLTAKGAARLSPLAPKTERQTTAEVHQHFERSRQFSSAFEFGTLVLCSAGAALIAAGVIYERLTATFENVTTHL